MLNTLRCEATPEGGKHSSLFWEDWDASEEAACTRAGANFLIQSEPKL